MTNFEELKKNITVEQLAGMTVKLVILNNTDPFYVTTTGQLFPMNPDGYKAAKDYELQFWNAEADAEEEKEG